MSINLNVRCDRNVKERAEQVFSELGLNMTTAINLFLRAAVREQGIPFELRLDSPNRETAEAIEEGRRIAHDENVPGYMTMGELRAALEA